MEFPLTTTRTKSIIALLVSLMSIIGCSMDVYDHRNNKTASCIYKDNPHSKDLSPLGDWTIYQNDSSQVTIECLANDNWCNGLYTKLQVHDPHGKLVYEEIGQAIKDRYDYGSSYDSYVRLPRPFECKLYGENGLLTHRAQTTQRFFCNWLCELDALTTYESDGTTVKSRFELDNYDPGRDRYEWQDRVDKPVRDRLLTVAKCYVIINESVNEEAQIISFVKAHLPK